MKLNQYFSLTRTSKQNFAEQLGVSPAYFSTIVNGKKKPSPRLAKKISELSNGYVTTDEILFPEDFPDVSVEEFFKMTANLKKLKKDLKE
jgi:transcriptional regulator with XRE-family HTH domain